MAVINEEDLQEYLEEQRALAEAPTEVDIPVAQVQEAPAQEFTNWDSYTSDPEYQTLDSAEKQELYDRWRQYATNYLASTGNLTTKDDLEFTKSYFSGIAEQEGLKGADYKPPNYAEQLIQQGQSGYRSLESGVAGYGALIGVADTESAANAIAERNRQEQEKYISPEFQDYSNKKLGFFGAVKEIITNPFDLALPFLAQSMGSNLPALASSLGIAGVGGAVAGPAGAASAGLYSSAILGGATDALVTVDQLIKEEVQKRGLNPTDPQAVASVLADPEFKTYAIKYANARGLAIGATGLAAFGLGNILAAPAREIAKAGVRGIAGEVGKQIGIQVVSEPVGEVAAQAGAQVATGQPIDIKGREVAEELVVGLPMSGVEAGVLTYKNLVENNAPATADEVLVNQVSDFRKQELERALARNEVDKFYGVLSIGEKAKTLGLAPNAVLTGEQSIFDTLTTEEKQAVQVAFEATKQRVQPPVLAREEVPAQAGEQPPVLKEPAAKVAAEVPPVLEPQVTAEEAEAEAAKAFEQALETTPPAPEVAVTPQEAVREAGAEAGVPAPAPETTAPISEAVQVPLEQVAPASAQAVAEEKAPAPVVETPAPAQPLTKKFLEEGIKNVSSLESMSKFFNEILTVLGRPPTKEEEAGLAAFIEGRIDVNGLPASLISEEQTPVSQLTDFGRLRQTVEKATGKKVTPAPVVETLTPVEPTTPKLPRNLAGAKPRYGFGSKQFGLTFANDIDRALYIIAQATKSAKDAEYLDFVMKATGMTEGQARAAGRAIRASIKEQARTSDADTLEVAQSDVTKPKVEAPVAVSATAPQAETPPAAPTPVAETPAPAPTSKLTTREIPESVLKIITSSNLTNEQKINFKSLYTKKGPSSALGYLFRLQESKGGQIFNNTSNVHTAIRDLYQEAVNAKRLKEGKTPIDLTSWWGTNREYDKARVFEINNLFKFASLSDLPPDFENIELNKEVSRLILGRGEAKDVYTAGRDFYNTMAEYDRPRAEQLMRDLLKYGSPENTEEAKVFNALDTEYDTLKLDKFVNRPIETPVIKPTLPVTPAPAPVTQKLPPTKKQVTALTKLGYLPADIEGLDRVQAKEIIGNQTPKTPTIEAPKEKTKAPAQAGAPAPAVPPAPVVGETPAASAQPPAGEVSLPVAPPASEPTTQTSLEERLGQADKKLTALLEKLGGVLGSDVKLDAASVAAFFGGVPDQATQARIESVLKLVNLGLSNVKARLKKAKAAGRNLEETFTNIDKLVFTNNYQGGGGIYADPRNPFEAGTLYINPDQLTRVLMSDLTLNPADFFASMLEEEVIHANHGKAMVRAFVQTFPPEKNKEVYASPAATLEAYIKFYDAQNAEIENSLTIDQIKNVVGKYAQSLGIDLAGKTKEQIVQEFNVGRPGRLAEEYLRALIQGRQLGSITEEQVRGYTTRPILRILGALRNWFRDLVGKGVQKRKTFVDRQHDAILSVLLSSSPTERLAAQGEINTAIPGRILASSIDPFAEELNRLNKNTNAKLEAEIQKEFGPRNKETGEGGLWRRTIIGRLKRSFPAVDPTEVESLVYASIPEAMGSFDEDKGAKFPTYLYGIAQKKILREKYKTLKRRTREVASFQAPGFYNIPLSLKLAQEADIEAEAEAPIESEDLTPEQRAEKLLARAPSLEKELDAQEKVSPVLEEKAVAAAYEPETGRTNLAEEGQELEELTLADGEAISSLDAVSAEKRTAYLEAQLGEAGKLLATAAKALGLTKIETEVLAYAADPDGSILTRKEITDKYGLTNDQFTNMRDDVLTRMREQLGRAGVTRTADVLASSIDPTRSQALARAKTTLPADVAAEIDTIIQDPFTDAGLTKLAKDFVKANSPNGDVMHAKRILDGRPNMKERERLAVLGVIGVTLRKRVSKVNEEIKKKGSSPERLALKNYLDTNLREVFIKSQQISSEFGQNLRSARTNNALYLPYHWEGLYTGPIGSQQEELLRTKQEVIKARAEIERLLDIISGDAVDGIYIKPPESPDDDAKIGVGDKPIKTPLPEGENFYELLSLFGDMSPTEGETFSDYLQRLGVNYDDVVSNLEGMKAASVSPAAVTKILPEGLKNLSAKEAIRKLVAIDKNFFGKLVALRIKSGGGTTEAQVAEGLDRKKLDVKDRPAELQTVFDFFGSTESTKPTSEAPIEKDILPPLVRLAKYAADTITDRVMRSLGADKAKMEKGSFEKLERQVRALVNAQFRQETNPIQASKEDTRSVEQRLLDMVQRIQLAETVFNDVKAKLQAEIIADNRAKELKAETQLSAKERADLEARANRLFNPNAINSLDSLLRKTIDFKAEARKHMSQRGASVESLTEVIKTKFPGFTPAQAESLGKFLSSRYARILKGSGERQLLNITRRLGEKATAMPKGKMQQLLELINLGAFDEEKFYNAIAERYDIPDWDPAIAEEIRRQADVLQSLPLGSDQQATATFQLQAYIAQKVNEQKRGWARLGRNLDVAASVWKAGVLSGPPTQIVNLGATHLNVLFELLAEANAYKKLAKTKGKDVKFGDFFKTGLIAYWDAVGRVGVEQASDAFSTGLTRFRNEKQIELSPLEVFKFDTDKTWTFNNYIAAWKIVGRAMAGADTYNSVIANEAKARMAARYALLTEGLTAEEATKRTQEIFDRNSATSVALQEQVNREEADEQFGSLAGLDPKSSAYRSTKRNIEAGKRRRFEQLRDETIAKESKLGETGMQAIRDFTQKATFNNRPEGLIGYIGGEIVGALAGKVPLLTPFAAFPRTIANIINSGLNYTPYGYARAYGFSIGNMFDIIRTGNYAFKAPEQGSVEFHKLQAQAFWGSIVAFTLIGLALRDIDEDWDDAFFAVTGRGPADAEQREQLRASGWTENTVKFGSLRFKHTDFPGLNTIFGAMALVSDMYRYGNLKEEDLATIATTAAMSIGNSIFDKQLLSGAKTLFEAVSDRGNSSDKAKRLIQSYTGGFLNPGFARWMTKTFNIGADGMVGVVDYKELNSTTAGWLMGLTPMAVVVGKPELNRLGEPIREYPYTATMRRFGFVPEVKEHPVFSPLVKAGLFVPGASIGLKIKDFEKGKVVQRKMDREEFYNYSKYNGEYLRRRLTPQKAQALARLASRSPEVAQKELEKLAGDAREYGKNRIEQEIRIKRRRK